MSNTSKVILGVIIAIAIVAIVWYGQAYAQVASIEPEKTYSPEFQSIINQLIGVALLVATGVLSWAGMAIRSYFASKGILAFEQTKDVKQSFFNQAALLALGLFETLKKKSQGNGDVIDWSKVSISDPLLKEAAEWMLKAWPEATEGMDLMDVMKSLMARMPTGQMTEKAQELAVAKAAGVAPIVVKA